MSVLIPKSQSYFFSSSPQNNAKGISSDGSTFSVQLDNPFQIPRGSVGCTLEVTQANVWNNAYNISAAIGNNIFRWNPLNTGYIDHVIPDGQYSLSGFNDELARMFIVAAYAEDYIQVGANDATQHTFLVFKVANVKVDFTHPNACRDVLGFNARIIDAPTDGFVEMSDEIAKFNRVNTYLIKSNIINGGIPVNNRASGIIASIPINVVPGSQIVYNPPHPVVADANDLVGVIKNYFTFSLIDQESRPVSTNGEYYSLVVVIKYYLLLTDQYVPMVSL